LPIAMAVALPLLAPHSAFGRWAARHWRDWTLLCLLGVFAIASVVVAYPDAIVSPGPSSLVTISVPGLLVAAVLAPSLRQLRFYDLGHHPANLAASLFAAEAIVTTEAKAKAIRPIAEKVITKAKKGGVHNQRQVVAFIRDKDMANKLFEVIGPRYADRNGGYTRILKLGPRHGDNAPMARIELV